MAIIAAAVGTPSILLRGNTFKNEGLASMLHSRFPVRSLDDQNGIVADALILVNSLQEERQRLRSAVDEIICAFVPAQNWLAAAFAGQSPDLSGFAEPPRVKVSPDVINFYCTQAEKGVDTKKFRKTSAPFGQRAPLGEILEPLLAGALGDPIRTRAAVSQVLAGNVTHVAELSEGMRTQLTALAPMDFVQMDNERGWKEAAT